MSQIKTKFIQDGAITDAKVTTGINANKLADGSVTNSEFQFINSLTSNAQDQMDTLDSRLDATEIVANAAIPLAQKAANNGVATLDAGGKIPAAQLPNTVMEFKGNYNATTNTPTLVDGTGNAGDVYLVNVAGTQDFGSGSQTFAVGDWVVYSGSIWQKSINSNTVVSVNGQQGVVQVNADDVPYDNTSSGLTATDVQAAIDEVYAAVPGAGANQSLSNLTPTSINEDLNPDGDFTRVIGNSSFNWASGFIGDIRDAANEVALTTASRQLSDDNSVKAITFLDGDRNLWDATGNAVLNYTNRILYDSATGLSLSFGNAFKITAHKDIEFDLGGQAQLFTKDNGATEDLIIRTGTASGPGNDSGELLVTTGPSGAGATSGNAKFASGDNGDATGMVTVKSGDTAGSNTTGAVNIITGEGSGSGSQSGILSLSTGISDNTSGNILIKTGNSLTSDSGSIVIETGTSAGTRGFISFVDGTEGTSGYVWTSIDTLGNGAWLPASGGSGITALTGDVTGTGPGSTATTLATVNSNVGSFGSATQAGTFTVNAKGLITAASNTSIQIAESQVTNLVSDLALKAPLASPALTGTPTAPTASQGNNSTQLATTAYVDTGLATKQATGNYMTALTGDVTAAGPGSSAATLATVNSNVGSFGSATQVSTVTVNAKGLITAASNTAIQIAESQVTNLVSDLAGKQATGNYITALTGDATAAGPGSAALTLATVNSNVGSFTAANITVNAKGLITAASNGASAPVPNKETFVLSGTNITNQYLDLAQVAKTGSILFLVKGGGLQMEGASYDYSVSYTGGAGGNTRITFLNDLATGGPAALVATDVVQVAYSY